MANSIWLRLYTDITRDLKIRRLPITARWVWITMLCMAKESPEPGALFLSKGVPATDKDIADEANVPLRETRSALLKFRELLMVECCEGTYILSNYKKRQFLSDSSAARVRKHREALQDRYSNGDVTPPESESETYIDDNDTCVKIEQYLGRPVTSFDGDTIADWEKKHPHELIDRAIKIASINGGQKLSYIDRVLLGWEQAGIKTIEQVEEHERRRSAGKQKAPPARSPARQQVGNLTTKHVNTKGLYEI